MAIDAGTVYYTVDAKTQKAIDDIVDVNTSLEEMEKTMAKTDVRTRQFKRTITEAGGSISKTGVVVDKFGDVNAEATQKMQKLMATTDALSEKQIRMTKVASGVSQGVSNIGRSAGQAGIQIQQFVGQIQGGQSAMLALSQQGADLGFVLGAPLLGAIIGIGASLIGMLTPNLMSTKDATDELEEALKSVEKVIKTNSDGINVLTNDYAELVKRSKELATAQLLLTKVEVDQIMNKSAEAAEEAFEKFDTFFNALDVSANVSVFDTLDDAMQRTDKSVIDLIENTDLYGTGLTQLKAAIENVNEEMGLTTDQSALVLRRFAEFRKDKTPEAFTRLSDTLLNIASSSRGKVTPEFVKLTSLISNQAFEAANAAEKSRMLEDALNGIGVATEETVSNMEKWKELSERLSTRTASLRSEQLSLEKALSIKKATEDGANQSTIDSIGASYDKLIANARETESEQKLAKAKRDKAAAERESQKASKAFIQDFGIEGDEFGESPDGEATEISRSVIDQYNPETTLEKLQRQRDLIEQFRDWEIGSAEEHAEALKSLDREIAEERLNNNKLVSGSLDALESAGTNAIAGILSGTMSASDAMRNLANSILNNAVGALVEMGIQYVKNQIIAQSASAASIATGTATATALSSAYATPATLASIATLGGAAATGGAAVAAAVAANQGLALAGMAHDGISEIPNEGTWLLNKGERVYTNDSARQLDQMYSRVMKPAYPSAAMSNPTNQYQQNTSPINLSVEIVNQIEDAQFQTQMTEEGVRIIATRVFNENIDKGVSGVLGKKGTKANKTMTSKYDTRNKY
ncbi:tail tape measure protein [Vibrio phage Seahorse]|uniref:Tail tape measure protein n=1 Tax=Vibrio phage Seahorse TaxID=2662136 RepID=A0A6B7SEA4_9CAUD|nr:tail tape measure protein [Vibrio phage Seahorse]QGF20992.1 tail tape measure protein [Vibrio phage Seahorse]